MIVVSNCSFGVCSDYREVKFQWCLLADYDVISGLLRVSQRCDGDVLVVTELLVATFAPPLISRFSLR